MKRYFLMFIPLVIIICLLFRPVSYAFLQDMSDLNQVQIEIVHIETDLGFHRGAAYADEYISVIQIIENDEKTDFISDFNNVRSYQPIIGGRIDAISGDAIRIIYLNGEIELITRYGTATVINGKIRVFTTTFDSDGFNALLEKYK